MSLNRCSRTCETTCRSLLTFMLYLNDDFEGGATSFPEQGKNIAPELGMRSFFSTPSFTLASAWCAGRSRSFAPTCSIGSSASRGSQGSIGGEPVRLPCTERRRICHRPLKLAVLPEKACGLRGLLCFPVRRKRGLRGGAAPSANDSTLLSRRSSFHPSRWRAIRYYDNHHEALCRLVDDLEVPQHKRGRSRIRVLEIVTTCFAWLLTGSRTPLDPLRSGTPRTPGARPRSHSRWDSWNS
jgi:hypothetical protein